MSVVYGGFDDFVVYTSGDGRVTSQGISMYLYIGKRSKTRVTLSRTGRIRFPELGATIHSFDEEQQKKIQQYLQAVYYVVFGVGIEFSQSPDGNTTLANQKT